MSYDTQYSSVFELVIWRLRTSYQGAECCPCIGQIF